MKSKMDKKRNHQVDWDGITVWINGSDGMCWARFGRGGIDIHNTAASLAAGSGMCLHCTHTRPTVADWITLVRECKAYYGVTVPEKAIPKWIEELVKEAA